MRLQLVDVKGYHIAPQYLSLYRILYCVCVVVFVGLPSYTWLSSDLNFLFNPPQYSLAGLFNGFPSALFFKILTLLNLIFFAMMFLGMYCRVTSIAFAVTAILGHNYCYSFGKIDHLLMWLIAPIFLSLAGWGDYLAINRVKNKNGLTDSDNSLYIIMLAAAIAFSMFTSGFQKFLGGWQNWEAEAVRFHLIKKYYSLGDLNVVADYLMTVKNHLVWKLFDYSALILEIGFLFSIMRRNWFQLFLAGGTVFHILVLLMFNIAFYSNIIVYLVFINWNAIFKLFNYDFVANSAKRIKFILCLTAASICVVLYWVYLFFTAGEIMKFPNAIDILTGQQALQAPSKTSMYLLFLSSLIVLVFCLFVTLINRLRARRVYNR
ncbi:hypothetical protein EOD41_12490 [Mucilaginibacter limnophilus]|uniref:HTTM domain-containing protein n=1 Tax=Mucilaginibacter limnophilus TaxID=1932778 RepID=A0A3S2WXG0_9SPHI|nr:hypothetical protein [Mucilaginibacter limnophilus]RVU00296.1 hypothetical protein EOD41_12490 [Mucilaginibacter limnophilus]